MGNLGGAEILVILLVALIVLGPTKLPPAVRQVGKFVGEIRRMGQGFQQELREASKPLAEATETLRAADPRNVISPKSPLDNSQPSDASNEAATNPTPTNPTPTNPTPTNPTPTNSESAGVVAGPVSWGTAEAKLSPQTAPATESGEDTQAVTDIVELDNVETPVESVPEVSVSSETPVESVPEVSTASETDSQMDTETRSSDIVS